MRWKRKTKKEGGQGRGEAKTWVKRGGGGMGGPANGYTLFNLTNYAQMSPTLA